MDENKLFNENPFYPKNSKINNLNKSMNSIFNNNENS